MKPIKIIQIGTAHDHASQTMGVMRRHPELFEVIGICTLSDADNENCAHNNIYNGLNVYSPDEINRIDGLEAAAIETDEMNGAAMAVLCARAGLSIHLDKPGSYRIDDFRELIEIMKAGKLMLQMGYMYRYNPIIRKMLGMAEAGELGRVFSVETDMSVEHSRAKRAWLSRFTGGAMYFLGCHMIDLVFRLMGEPLETVPWNVCSGLDGLSNSDDFGTVLLKYSHGSATVRVCAAEAGGFGRRRITVCGTKGTFEICPIENHIHGKNELITFYRFTKRSEENTPWSPCAPFRESDPFDRYEDMMVDFARCVRHEKKVEYSYEYEMKLFELLMRCCTRSD